MIDKKEKEKEKKKIENKNEREKIETGKEEIINKKKKKKKVEKVEKKEDENIVVQIERKKYEIEDFILGTQINEGFSSKLLFYPN
jgi:hypothetical protein